MSIMFQSQDQGLEPVPGLEPVQETEREQTQAQKPEGMKVQEKETLVEMPETETVQVQSASCQ